MFRLDFIFFFFGLFFSNVFSSGFNDDDFFGIEENKELEEKKEIEAELIETERNDEHDEVFDESLLYYSIVSLNHEQFFEYLSFIQDNGITGFSIFFNELFNKVSFSYCGNKNIDFNFSLKFSLRTLLDLWDIKKSKPVFLLLKEIESKFSDLMVSKFKEYVEDYYYIEVLKNLVGLDKYIVESVKNKLSLTYRKVENRSSLSLDLTDLYNFFKHSFNYKSVSLIEKDEKFNKVNFDKYKEIASSFYFEFNLKHKKNFFGESETSKNFEFILDLKKLINGYFNLKNRSIDEIDYLISYTAEQFKLKTLKEKVESMYDYLLKLDENVKKAKKEFEFSRTESNIIKYLRIYKEFLDKKVEFFEKIVEYKKTNGDIFFKVMKEIDNV